MSLNTSDQPSKVLFLQLAANKRAQARVKGKVHKTVARPAVVYGLETVALTKRREAELVVAGLKMLRFLVVTKDGAQ